MADRFWYPSERISPDNDDAFTQTEIDDIIETISESSFLDDESGLSIDERMTEVFGGEQPEWSGFQTYAGFCCVNCGGVLRRRGEDINVIIQFTVANDFESFVLSGMLINGIEQPEGLILQFEEQFATDPWENDGEEDDDGGFFAGGETYDPRARFADSGYAGWEETSVWESEEYDEDDDDDEEDECGCGHHHHHHHDHAHAGEIEDYFADDDGEPDWGDDAAERFWYGSDEDDWHDDGN